MITELGKGCQEMARIEDFVFFKSELLGALGDPLPIFVCLAPLGDYMFLPHFKNILVTAMDTLALNLCSEISLAVKNIQSYVTETTILRGCDKVAYVFNSEIPVISSNMSQCQTF